MRLIDAEPLERILQSRCAQCSNDYGSLAGAISGCLKLLQAQPTIAPPPNPPLTLEELREMDGEPVCIYNFYNGLYSWHVVSGVSYSDIVFTDCWKRKLSCYGDGWLAYRRKPEKVTT